MDFNLTTLLVFITGALAGAVAGLKVIAPFTKNTIDDRIEEFAEKALAALKAVPASK